MQTITMMDLMQLNLFTKITGVKTSSLFKYNNIVFFGVAPQFLRMALGDNASNLKKVGDAIRRRVRIVPLPKSKEDRQTFFEKITDPISIKEIQETENEILINSGGMNKAALIGRDKRRLIEMQKISKDFFGKDLRVI